MLFNSLEFLIYFPIVVAMYFLLPFRFRWMWLLGASYYFYMNWNAKYLALLVLSTVVTFSTGLLIEREDSVEPDEIKRKNNKKIWLYTSFIINLGILFMFKYYNFFTSNIESVFEFMGYSVKLPNFKLLLPVGISFYIFQALGYTIDVYTGKLKAYRHLGRYALFVSFFPQLVAGPIERAGHLLPQFEVEQKFSVTRVRDGIFRMQWGLFKKVVIADRLAVVVDTVYNSPSQYEGLTLVVATVFFAFQIYTDFSSYSDIAIGAAEVMGFKLNENFIRPYFAKSMSEFWRRWHMSLGTWFRDYIYFPLGGNKFGKWIKYRNIMIVFLISGAWHGASWNFIIWGALNGAYQVIEQELAPSRAAFRAKFKIKNWTFGYRMYQLAQNFTLVCFTWVFFRANTFQDAKYILKNIFVFNPEKFFDGSLYKLGLSVWDFNVGVVGIVILLTVHYFQRDKSIRVKLTRENFAFRWIFFYLGVLAILAFGYFPREAVQFIYFQF